MNALVETDVFLFEDFRLDRRGGGLFRRDGSGVFVPIPIGSRALEVLEVLVERAGELVTRDELMDAVWPGIVVESSNLPVQIAALRRVLDEGRADGSCIQTVAGRGYRFLGKLARDGGGSRPRLSIVVLPFANLSNDPEQQYFADGITEDLTSELSRIENMFVISRNTAFMYRNRPIDTKQMGRELAVRYVLEGSVRRSGGQVRLNAQLIDAATDAHLWAERFDRDTGDLFALQDEITNQIANALGVELIAAEAARPTKNLDALDYNLRGRAALLKPRTRETYKNAIDLFEHALALDSQSAEVQSRLAVLLVTRVLEIMSDSAEADLARADMLVVRALRTSPRYAYAHFAKGHLLRAQNRWEEAITEYEVALELNHNLVHALVDLAWCKLYTGSLDQVIPLVQQAIRLSPRDPLVGGCYVLTGTVHLLQSRTDEAIAWLEKARTAIPAAPVVHSRLASAYALRGNIERADAELTQARKLNGGDVFSSLARLRTSHGGWWGAPKTRALYEATYFAGLRKAGMPEE